MCLRTFVCPRAAAAMPQCHDRCLRGAPPPIRWQLPDQPPRRLSLVFGKWAVEAEEQVQRAVRIQLLQTRRESKTGMANMPRNRELRAADGRGSC